MDEAFETITQEVVDRLVAEKGGPEAVAKAKAKAEAEARVEAEAKAKAEAELIEATQSGNLNGVNTAIAAGANIEVKDKVSRVLSVHNTWHDCPSQCSSKHHFLRTKGHRFSSPVRMVTPRWLWRS